MTLIRLTAIYDEKGIAIGDRLLGEDMETLHEYANAVVAHINADVVSIEVTPIANACPNCGGPEGYPKGNGGHAVGCIHGPSGPDPIELGIKGD